MTDVIVYTALIGEGWHLYDPDVVERSVDYVCFTDDPTVKSKVWQVKLIQKDGDPRIQSRLLKCRPELVFPNAEATLWMDSRFRLMVPPRVLVKDWLSFWDMAALRHPDRDRIEDEALAIAQMGLAPLSVVEEQVKAYRADGWAKQRAITSTGLCIRRHSKTVIEFGKLWWDEVRSRCHRDQMSVDYCAWKAGLRIGYMPGHYRENPWAEWRKVAPTKCA